MKRFAKRLRHFGVLDTPSALAAAKRYMPEGLNKSSPKTHQAMMLRIVSSNLYSVFSVSE